MPFEYQPRSGESPLNTKRCKARVHSHDRNMTSWQCNRKRWKEGWCKIHHPESESARKAASFARFQEQAAKEWRQTATAERERILKIIDEWWKEVQGTQVANCDELVRRIKGEEQ